MLATMNSGMKKGFLVAFLMVLLFTMFGPVVAHANGAIPEVKVGSDGSINITGGGFETKTGTDGKPESAWNQIIEKYRGFIVGISGIGAITMVVIFIFQFLKLGASAGNPNARSAALTGVLWSGIAAAGLGSVTLIVGLFYRAIG